MKLGELTNKYDLHDSLIEKIEYHPINKVLEVNVKLCNWRQPLYSPSEAEVISGRLIFYGVIDYTVTPFTAVFDSEEILKTEITCDIENDTDILKLVVRNSDDVIIIIINAIEVDWVVNVI